MSILNWFSWKRVSAEEKELQTLRKGLNTVPAELSIADLFPVFVPASFIDSGNWPGPIELYEVSGLALTWSILLPNQTMRYVDGDTVCFWNGTGTNWRERANQNLMRSANDSLYTHEFRREDGHLYAVALMQDDGLGPSRLLAKKQFDAVFPAGYLVSLPEMSCGFALSVDSSEMERAKLESMVAKCFTDGTRPLIPGWHPSASLVPRFEK